VKVTDLDNSRGYWTATIHTDSAAVAVDRRFGSWRITPSDPHRYRTVRPGVAAELQERVRKLERQARRDG